MRSGIIAVGLAGLVVLVGISIAFVRHRTEEVAEPSFAVENADQAADIVQVDELAAKPEDYQGEIVLRAVVAGTNHDESVVSVIDTREFARCGTLSCAKYYVPVKISGELPQPKSHVQITGQVVQKDRGLVVESRQVNVLP